MAGFTTGGERLSNFFLLFFYDWFVLYWFLTKWAYKLRLTNSHHWSFHTIRLLRYYIGLTAYKYHHVMLVIICPWLNHPNGFVWTHLIGAHGSVLSHLMIHIQSVSIMRNIPEWPNQNCQPNLNLFSKEGKGTSFHIMSQKEQKFWRKLTFDISKFQMLGFFETNRSVGAKPRKGVQILLQILKPYSDTEIWHLSW